ncbi:MAG: T9SS type A sorting domain-containing protein [Bacteroidetes bacterium]|nr:T9SS type A sorting domain-containing protein [Bacteroidota bacterium]
MKKLIAILFLFVSLQLSAGWVYDAVLKIWYNTETGEILIVGDDDADDDVGSIIVYNAQGQKQVVRPQSNEGEKKISIDATSFEEGMYIIQVENKAQTKSITKKIYILR